VGRNDSVCINRMISGGVWQRIRAAAARPSGSITAVAAHRDTVIVAYSDNGRIRYQLKRGGGAWTYGSPPQDTTLTNTNPDVSGDGGCFHLVYRDNTGKGFYTRRTYGSFTWDAPLLFSGDDPVAYSAKPDVRWIGRGDTAGIAWVGIVSGSGGHAFYTCFDYTGLAESGGRAAVAGLSARPSQAGIVIRYSLDRPGPATLRAWDVAGRVLRTWRLSGTEGSCEFLWPDPGNGLRFFELVAGNRRLCTKVILAR
jgi:hypothetical protein